MITVTASIHINAPASMVFALLADPAAKAALNPMADPIRVEIDGGGRLELGSRCHYRMQFGNTIIDYSGRVTRFEENWLIESCTDTEPPLYIRVETMNEDGGTRLTQTERFEASDALLDGAIQHNLKERSLWVAYKLALLFDTDVASKLRSLRESMLRTQLNGHLRQWLMSIKGHIEKSGV